MTSKGVPSTTRKFRGSVSPPNEIEAPCTIPHRTALVPSATIILRVVASGCRDSDLASCDDMRLGTAPESRRA